MESESLMPENETIKKPNYKGSLPQRYIFAILGSLGFINVYAMRINLSISMVAMVNSSVPSKYNTSSECTDNHEAVSFHNDSTSSQNGEFYWDQYTQGIILGSFFWGYILTQLPGGRCAELYSGKWIFGVGILWTAIFTLLTPIAANLGVPYLVAVRVLEGLGEGVTFPTMNIMLSRWSPPTERSFMTTITFSGALLGTVIGLPLSGYLVNSGYAGGWPSVFYVFGSLGVVWFVFWSFFAYDSPMKHPWISSEEKEYITKSLGYSKIFLKRSPPFPWRKALTSQGVWAIIIAHFCNNWGFYTLLTELPTYLHTMLNLDMNKNSLLSAIPYFTCWLFGMVCSSFGDWIIRRKLISVKITRKTFNFIGNFIPAACLLGITFAGCNEKAIYLLLVAAMTTNGATYCGYGCNHIDIASNFAGTLLGISNSIATIPGWMGPYVVGAFTNNNNTMHQWNNVFYLSSSLYLVSCIFFTILAQGDEQPWNKVFIEP